jgi:hypothetical protein
MSVDRSVIALALILSGCTGPFGCGDEKEGCNSVEGDVNVETHKAQLGSTALMSCLFKPPLPHLHLEAL